MPKVLGLHEVVPPPGMTAEEYEEIFGKRLLELALITARTVGIEILKNGNIRFVPGKKTKAMDASSGDWVEIIEVDVNGGTVEACYGVIDGKPFAESPCGG